MKTEPTQCSSLLGVQQQPPQPVIVPQPGETSSANTERRKEMSLKRKALFAKIPKGFSEILTGKLWLGSGRDARQKHKLLDLGITHIVNCAIEWKNHYPSSFVYFNGNVFDNENQDLSVFFSEAFDFLDEVLKVPTNRVFIHCVVGKSRSAALTIAYLMRVDRLTLKQAYTHVKECRPLVCPNDGFMRQLMAFEMQVFNTTTSSLTWGEWKNQTKCALAPPTPTLPLPITIATTLQDPPPSHLTTSNQFNLLDSSEKENFNINTESNHTSLSTTETPTQSSQQQLEKITTSTSTTTSTTTSTSAGETLVAQGTRRSKIRTEIQQAALDTFVQTHITPELLRQGLREVCGGVYDSDCVGSLLQWVHHGIRDSTSCAEGVRREGLSWRDIAHSIDESAKQWLRQQEDVSKDNLAT